MPEPMRPLAGLSEMAMPALVELTRLIERLRCPKTVNMLVRKLIRRHTLMSLTDISATLACVSTVPILGRLALCLCGLICAFLSLGWPALPIYSGILVLCIGAR